MSMMQLLFYPTAIGSEPQDPSLDSHAHWATVMKGHAGANLVSLFFMILRTQMTTSNFPESLAVILSFDLDEKHMLGPKGTLCVMEAFRRMAASLPENSNSDVLLYCIQIFDVRIFVPASESFFIHPQGAHYSVQSHWNREILRVRNHILWWLLYH